ncbi:unnamed protein product [Camellia sinensis]
MKVKESCVRTQSQKSQEERERENRQREEVMILLQKVKEKERREMDLAPAHMSKGHILCEKQGKINEAYKKLEKMAGLVMEKRFHLLSLQSLAAEYSECPSGKKGGDLGWFPRGKMAGLFQDVAFSTTVGATSAPFKSTGMDATLSCPNGGRIDRTWHSKLCSLGLLTTKSK